MSGLECLYLLDISVDVASSGKYVDSVGSVVDVLVGLSILTLQNNLFSSFFVTDAQIKYNFK